MTKSVAQILGVTPTPPTDTEILDWLSLDENFFSVYYVEPVTPFDPYKLDAQRICTDRNWPYDEEWLDEAGYFTAGTLRETVQRGLRLVAHIDAGESCRLSDDD
jgi:hypothetical protein